jgi:hypothetical protein
MAIALPSPNENRTGAIQTHLTNTETQRITGAVNSIALPVLNNNTSTSTHHIARITRAAVRGLVDGIVPAIITYVVFRILGLSTDNTALLFISSYLLFDNNFSLFPKDPQQTSLSH